MSWPLLSSARVVAAMSSCNALPVIMEISPTITAGCITKTFISFFILAAGLTAQGGSSNILVIAVPAELVLAQVVDHVWCVECLFKCVACVNRKGRVGVSCNSCWGV